MKKLFLLSFLLIISVTSFYGQEINVKSSSVVTIDGESYYVHTVRRGETLFSLSRTYGVGEREIKDNNPQTREGLQVDQVLKIPVVQEQKKLTARKRNRIFDTHTVAHGETLYSISRQYGVPIATLIEDNEGLDPSQLSIGQKLSVRKESIGDATPDEIAEQFEEYRDAINRISEDVVYHLVESGETIYGISRLYGVSEEDIISVNKLTGGLRAGELIRIPSDDPQRYVDMDKQVIFDSLDTLDRLEYERLEHERWLASRKELVLRDLSGKSPINIALMLPLTGESSAGKNFIDLYQGILLGLEDLKNMGISTELTLYDTQRSNYQISSIVESSAFAQTDIIIGPVYETNAAVVVDFAERNGVAIVSPLAVFDSIQSPFLYQMSPVMATKYSKILDMITPDVNVIYINTEGRDQEMDMLLKPYLPSDTKYMDYSRSTPVSSIQRNMAQGRENLIIISSINEFTVDELLAKISSMQTNLTARSIGSFNLRTVGNSRWTRFRNIDRDLFFKLNVCFITTYHADRGDERVRKFDSRYISAFGSLPNQYAYRGYDAVKLFVGSASSPGDFNTVLNSDSIELLQTSYNFVHNDHLDSYRNTEWAMVCHSSDYSICVD